MGHPGAPLPLEIHGPRIPAGEAHAGDIPRADQGDGRRGLLTDADQRGWLRHRRGRRHHPRAGRRAHGCRPQNLGREQQLPDARGQESLRGRWRSVHVAGRQESHLDDHGAVVADVRIHRGPTQEEGAMKRREAVGAMAMAALTAAFKWTPAEAARAAELARNAMKAKTPFAPAFFTPHEWETVRVLVDLVIPRDERSGSATDAGVPEYMDFMLNDRPDGQTPMRGGLAWLDNECSERFGKTFVAATPAEQTAELDDIDWPKEAKTEMSQGVAFYNMFRDMTASGVWPSKLRITDLNYQGNTFVAEWHGRPS